MQQGATANSYNGDGALVAQASSGAATRSTQDLASPLSQVLQISQGGTTTSELYGVERLAATSGSTRTWCQLAPYTVPGNRRLRNGIGYISIVIAQ